ncbi:MAG: hypothetical protein K0R67_1997 [Paenibacillus sp.]|jgi:AraC-like DNA-binding protein|nr:hypothetical protein [Paenibacillus sp.]
MKKSWFYRMLFTYMPVFLAVCFTLLFILFLSVRQLSLRSSVQSNEAIVNNAAQVLEQNLRSIESSMFQLVYSEPTIIGFYANPYWEDGRALVYQTARTLINLQTRYPLLHSVYLVNPEEDLVLETFGISNLKDYPDKLYIETTMNSDKLFVWGSRRKIPIPGAEHRSHDVISIARIANLRTNGLLVAQIQVKDLQTLLSQSVDITTGYISITDADGNSISSTIPTEEAGKGHKKLASMQMTYTGWYIESGVLQPGMLSWAEPVLNVSLSIGSICMILGVVWFVIATRYHYRPVRNLLTQVDSFAIRKPLDPILDSKRDEFQTIGRAIDQLRDHSNQLKLENDENKKIRKEFHFRRMAEGRFDAASFYGQREEGLFGLHLAGGRPTAIRVEIDRYARTVGAIASDEERNHQLLTLQSSLDAILEGERYSFTTSWLSDKHLGAIVMLKETVEVNGGLVASLERFRDWTENHLPYTVTIAMGVSVDRIEAISISFQTTARLLSLKMSLGNNRFIPLDALEESGESDLTQELERIEEMSRSLRLGEMEWEHELTILTTTLSTRLFGGEQVRNLLNVFLFHVQHKMGDLPVELEGIWQQANARLMTSLKEGESLAELSASLKSILGTVSAQIRLWRESKNNRSIIQEIKHYIDNNYFNPDLSQAMLSTVFCLHQSSISRVFKDEYGVKFVDYVNDLRVKQAILLMENEDLPIQIIAERVGFLHSNTFIQVFKKITGETPGNYRKERSGQ